jgi:LAGLIDADG endonuclease
LQVSPLLSPVLFRGEEARGGEGNFSIKIMKGTNKIGYRVQLKFRLVQHIRDKLLMQVVNKYFNTGNIYKYSEKSAVVLEIFKFSDIVNIILPFFDKYPILGVKHLDYLDWCKVVKLMKPPRGRGSTFNEAPEGERDYL